MKQILALVVAAAAAFAGTPREPQFLDTAFAGASAPSSLAWAPDGSGRLFVTMKTRGVGVIENGKLRTPYFATFSPLYTASECGVLGLAFDPDFATNHYVYVFVTVSATEQQIVRFTDQGSIGTERTLIIGGLPTRGRNHNGGALAFGPDGKLYWAVGDNGIKRGVDGDLTSLAAKVGRANPDGSAPEDNPFFDGPGPNNDYIWATGFRNPFTMTFHPATGELWLNVVGSTPTGQTSPHTTAGYEQAFVIHAGDDGGYDDYEGNQPDGVRFTTPFPRPCVKPRIQYKTDYAGNGTLLRTIAHAGPDGSGNLVVDVTAAHAFRKGEAVVLSGAGQYDGPNVVQAVVSPTQVALVLPAGESGEISAGKIDEMPQGECIVGGCFYDGASFPAEYAGNFFYGDLDGRIMRAQFDAAGYPQKITVFIDGAFGVTDLAVGPDGALYYTLIGGAVRRVSFVETPDVLVAPPRLALSESGRGTVNVRLAAPPATPTTVFAHRIEPSGSGGHNIDVESGAAVQFTAENWNRTQPVTIVAPPDADMLNEAATFAFRAPRYRAATVTATALDRNRTELVYSTTSVTLAEGGTAEIQVSLPGKPTGLVKAVARRSAGLIGKVKITQGATLYFTPDDWNVPKTVQLTGLQDLNKDPEIVDLQWIALGYRATTVRVSVVDDDPRLPFFTSSAKLRAVVGRLYSYQPSVRALPAAAFSLIAAPTGMNVDPDSGLITWTPDTRGDFPVTLRASNSLGSADQSFLIAVKPDTAPLAFVFEPAEGATIGGADAEFWGVSIDDYDTWKAEFYVDDVLVSTDTNRAAHYHLGGAHRLFDTTALTNGPHVLKMIVTDDAGQTGEASVTVNVAN